ncbi:MAG: YHS domain-containing protein [Deltaproteobacteria bacterium]|nr:YHS domain-containing protein [Deltaproteobacteria bacterium]
MIFRLLIGIVILYLVYKVVRMFRSAPPELGTSGALRKPKAGEDLVEDPLCHTYIPVSNAWKATVDGKTLYFCSQKCLDQYIRQREGGETGK